MAVSEKTIFEPRSFPFTPRILVVEARFYPDVADAMYEGAEEVLLASGCEIDRIDVPGALEIPGVIRYVAEAADRGNIQEYNGYIALGCVIRGETSHYDHVCTESIHALQNLVLANGFAAGNGILTVENHEQAMARADKARGNKGGAVADACLRMLEIKQQLGLLGA